MKIVNLKKGPQSQFYLLPTLIVAKNYLGKRYFICWIYWSIEI